MSLIKAAVASLLLALLSACASPVAPGMTREEVVSRLGSPPAIVPLATGSRFQYSAQPSGQTAVMVDFDASNRVVSARQVLNANDFARIRIGQWTRADIEREFGRPATIDHVASWQGDILAYRWKDFVNKFFWVYLDQNNVVQRTQEGPDEDEIRFFLFP